MNLQSVVYISALFFLSEFGLLVVKHAWKKGIKASNDRMSMVFLWIAITGGITLGFLTASQNAWTKLNDLITLLGLCIFLAGSVIRWISILQLKHEFTVNVVIRENHKLKTNGMYKKIRHPSYAGLLMMCLGLSVAMNSYISVIMIVTPVFLATLYRIKVEENILLKEFAGDYEKYITETDRIIPGLF